MTNANNPSIRAIIFGATGMIGQAVLRECLENNAVTSVLMINRRPMQLKHEKLNEIVHTDFSNLSSIANEFTTYDTCFYSLGASAVGMSEQQYHHLTYDLTVSIAETLLQNSRPLTFCYISGAGTDSTEKGRVMWARVKGKLENKLLSMPFKKAYMFRPGYIQPMKGIKSRTRWYNIIYTVFKPVYYLLKPFKGIVTNSSALGKAMINVALYGYEKTVIGNTDINKISRKCGA